MTPLNPCKVCGREDLIFSAEFLDPDCWIECYCGNKGPAKQNEREAIKAWNKENAFAGSENSL